MRVTEAPDESGVSALIATYYEGFSEVFELAALYFAALARVVDGNKRTALAVCLLFLRRNGVEPSPTPDMVETALREPLRFGTRGLAQEPFRGDAQGSAVIPKAGRGKRMGMNAPE